MQNCVFMALMVGLMCKYAANCAASAENGNPAIVGSYNTGFCLTLIYLH